MGGFKICGFAECGYDGMFHDKTTLACADVCGTMFDRALMNLCDCRNMDCRGASFIQASLIQCNASDLNAAGGTFTPGSAQGELSGPGQPAGGYFAGSGFFGHLLSGNRLYGIGPGWHHCV